MIQYLIALTDSMDGSVYGVVIVPGEELGQKFHICC